MKTLPSSTTIDVGDDMQDIMFKKRGCCFWIPFFGCNSSTTTPSSLSSSYGLEWWDRMRTSENKIQWWAKGWKKIREWSEFVVRPKWKTFIRRFNKNRTHGYTKQGSFQYDPLSYARNFEQKGDEHFGYADFSSRFASLPASAITTETHKHYVT
ncbi:hypothetical protein RIF29_14563 [Crotalaria pallida]|uniref:Uncharacterized protein n=1 Tax=Crotalaria pallida TaxID=3830 RepID=A0AAN9FFK8_CROPI